jgi:hypothetical protein
MSGFLGVVADIRMPDSHRIQACGPSPKFHGLRDFLFGQVIDVCETLSDVVAVPTDVAIELTATHSYVLP